MHCHDYRSPTAMGSPPIERAGGATVSVGSFDLMSVGREREPREGPWHIKLAVDSLGGVSNRGVERQRRAGAATMTPK